MRESVVVRDFARGEQRCDAPRERSGGGENNAEPLARRIGEELQGFCDNRLRLLDGVVSDEELDLRRGGRACVWQLQHFDQRTLQMIDDVRARLVEPFRSLPDLDLMVEDLFMVAMKPATAS